MSKEMLTALIVMGICALIALAAFFWRKKLKRIQAPTKRNKRSAKFAMAVLIAGLWGLVVEAVALIFGSGGTKAFTVEIWAERTTVWGMDISVTVLTTWCVMAVLVLAAVLIRIFVIPKMTDRPHGVGAVLEIAVEAIGKYTSSRTPNLGDGLPAYLFSMAALMLGCAAVELFGFRAPTADITMTFAFALVTFFLINYYGFKRKGFFGRVKSLAQPTPIVFPIRVLSDIAVPVSMACRLFGNMLGGMIVMELLYSALGGAAVGIPSVLGLYFNAFHPLIQIFIFITLSLTFINEAAES